MILVVDGGRLAEYDTPQNLLENENSLFAKLVEEARASDSKASDEYFEFNDNHSSFIISVDGDGTTTLLNPLSSPNQQFKRAESSMTEKSKQA
ncbi:hypothetical protein LPJ63_002769 [Coemansia sp. RSA 2711]|nr:hypothetical protein LPJ63_002769 [Coemansia sp. RSA 2711]